MKNKKIISPIGLKGKEIHERQLALMGIKPINENENKINQAVELTKIGPDGNAYAIVRENHEYYIKKTNKTKGLVLEDFKYIGGLQNKKDEAYPSYAKAIKQLNLKFKSLAESYNKGGDINVFEDDNLLEHHPYKADQKLSATKGLGDNQEYVVDKSGTPLSNKAKEGKEKGQFGDNVADKDVDDEFEKVNESFGFGFTGEGNLHGNKPMQEYDEKAMQNFIDQYGEEKGKQIYYATANKEDRDPETFKKNEGMTSFGDDVELNEYEAAIEEMMARMEGEEDYVDYTMGREDDSNQLPNPPRELNIPEGSFPNMEDDSVIIDKLANALADFIYYDKDSAKFRIYSGSGYEGAEEELRYILGDKYDRNKDYEEIIKQAKEKLARHQTVQTNEEMETEELHGGQHKLDVAEPKGKLTKADFDALNSMEESIKRLDALLEGELKKKAQTLTKKK